MGQFFWVGLETHSWCHVPEIGYGGVFQGKTPAERVFVY